MLGGVGGGVGGRIGCSRGGRVGGGVTGGEGGWSSGRIRGRVSGRIWRAAKQHVSIVARWTHGTAGLSGRRLVVATRTRVAGRPHGEMRVLARRAIFAPRVHGVVRVPPSCTARAGYFVKGRLVVAARARVARDRTGFRCTILARRAAPGRASVALFAGRRRRAAVVPEWALLARVLRRLVLVFSLRAGVAGALNVTRVIILVVQAVMVRSVVFAGGAARRARDARRFTGLPVVFAGWALRARVPHVV